MILPGATIGILGGGQLGRMLAVAAAQLGYRVHVFAPERDPVAGEVAAAVTQANWEDRTALARFAAACDVVTYEFENVPVAPLAVIPAGKLRPGAAALETAQDRLAEKCFVEGLGGRTAPWMPVDTDADFARATERIGTPGILKTRRDGYDGKGQWRVEDAAAARTLRLPGAPCIYEGHVAFEAEFSVVVARGPDGACRFYPAPRNRHEDGILVACELPAGAAVAAHEARARDLAAAIARALDYTGVLACEFFACDDGPVFNEMAPRVHNSGHWTVEGAITSQFENHIRAICGLPLGETALAGTAVRLENLIGGRFDPAAILADPTAHLHLYGKQTARAGRKMGHVTRVDRPGADGAGGQRA